MKSVDFDLDGYFRSHFGYLKNPAKQVYLLGIPYLERRQGGVCRQVTANKHEFAAASCLSPGPTLKALEELSAEGVIECKKGQAVIGGAATQVRRRSIQEMKTKLFENHLDEHTPPTAQHVVDALSTRSFTYGTDDVYHRYSVAKTGRLFLTGCPAQREDEKTRISRLLKGLADGQVLIVADYKTAEPTVIMHCLVRGEYLRNPVLKDMYQTLASALHIGRQKAKVEVNRLMYSRNSPASARAAGVPSDSVVMEVMQAVTALKEDLWRRGKATQKLRRHVHTLGNTLIVAQANEKGRVHRGKLLAWLAQGTVADIMNAAVLDILDKETTQRWRFLLPVHDSVYVATEKDVSGEIAALMKKNAEQIGVSLDVKTSVHSASTDG